MSPSPETAGPGSPPQQPSPSAPQGELCKCGMVQVHCSFPFPRTSRMSLPRPPSGLDCAAGTRPRGSGWRMVLQAQGWPAGALRRGDAGLAARRLLCGLLLVLRVVLQTSNQMPGLKSRRPSTHSSLAELLTWPPGTEPGPRAVGGELQAPVSSISAKHAGVRTAGSRTNPRDRLFSAILSGIKEKQPPRRVYFFKTCVTCPKHTSFRGSKQSLDAPREWKPPSRAQTSPPLAVTPVTLNHLGV